ncbi:DUF4351 domain-containing protein [Crocosphaera sp.]|uniref:DUF4351 domain-containing protein n=1 Tax=Crocosphaera sp. TaxID=2729996 RepID=UPI0026358C4B|nr:DUF4351 domain-containing protein [Crocosphaera sp.]MDJ0583376.1 DUF4351 domain-containing protein [Crocosphaera sp.]
MAVAITDEKIQQQLIALIETIIVYKFPQQTREEITAMFELSDLKKTRFYQEAWGEGRQEEAVNIVLRQLKRRFREIPVSLTEQIQGLSVEQLESLGEDLLDFETQDDLVQWLKK